MQILEQVLVALIVGASILYCLWRLTPARAHLFAIDLLRRIPGDIGAAWSDRLRKRVLSGGGGGCGGCSSGVKAQVHGGAARPAAKS